MSLPVANGIMAAACSLTGLTRQELTSPSRFKRVHRPRQAIMYAMIERTAWSTTQIGRWLKRDHSTVIHGHRIAAKRIATDPEFAGLISALMDAPEWGPLDFWKSRQIVETLEPLRPAFVIEPPAPPVEVDHIELQDRELRAAQVAGSARLASAIQQARAQC